MSQRYCIIFAFVVSIDTWSLNHRLFYFSLTADFKLLAKHHQSGATFAFFLLNLQQADGVDSVHKEPCKTGRVIYNGDLKGVHNSIHWHFYKHGINYFTNIVSTNTVFTNIVFTKTVFNKTISIKFHYSGGVFR